MNKKYCEWCGKELENQHNTYCNRSCSARGRQKKYGPPKWSEKSKKEQGDRLRKRWQTGEFRKNNLDRMKNNNPSYQDGVIEKANETRLKNGSMKNNFKYGNGKISKYEAIVFNFLTGNGFYYNYAINTKMARNAYPEKRFSKNYKPDYVHLKKRIAVEIDGVNHTQKHMIELDNKKDFCLNYLGINVYRFTHAQIDNYEKFKSEITKICLLNS